MFATQQFLQTLGVELAAIVGTHHEAASPTAKGLLCIANLMQCYNPLFGAVRQLVQSRVLGDCLHGWFENYACD